MGTSSGDDDMGGNARDGDHSGEASGGDDGPSDGDQLLSISRVRGAALLRNIRALTCSGANKITLTLNSDLKPVGKHSSLYSNYLGYLARTMVSIAYKDWRVVPQETKLRMYGTLMVRVT